MSTFDTPTGTRGAWMPPMGGRVGRWLTDLVSRKIRSTGKAPGLGFNALVLTTIGRKSGQQRSTPVGWFPGDDGSYLVVASAMGAQKNPAWYHNLAANPDRVRIETAGTKLNVTAEQLHGPDRQRAWDQITAAQPRFEKYQEKTDRQLPIIRLTSQGD